MAIIRSVPARRVKRLRVRADAADAARHAGVMLADALSTATLPGADTGQFVVIRKLALGWVSASASPASLALQIERAAREIASEAVPFHLASAATANAVTFPDRTEAVVALARRTATGSPADDWFWTLVVPGWNARAPRKDRWASILEVAHDGPEAAIVAAAVLDEAIRAGAEADLLSSLSPGDGARWLRRAGWVDLKPAPAGAAAPPLRSRHADRVRTWSRRWNATDDRVIWLATLATVIEQPACGGDPRLPARVAAALSQAVGAPPERPYDGNGRSADASSHDAADRSISMLVAGEVPATQPRVHDASDRTTADSRGDDRRAVPRDAAEVAPGPEIDASALARREAAQEAREPSDLVIAANDGVFTFFAGLLFVIPILERLQFGTFLATHPALRDAGFPLYLLRFVGRRVGLPPEDPLAIALDGLIGDDEPERAGRSALDSSADLWLTAIRRWCRRRARMRLTSVVRRHGRVHMTRTHVDATFALSQLDVRVRRLALDVNPGWVPWLGRVVQFTYDGYNDDAR